VPVPQALPRRGELPSHRGKPFALFPWVQGDVRCARAVGPEDCREVGSALAAVHLASSGIAPLGPGRFGPDSMLERVRRMEREAPRPELMPVLTRVRGDYARLVPLRDATLPTGIVHGDLFRDNVLFSGSHVVALLDFESAFRGPIIYDLMVTLAAWCYRSSFELELARDMVAGYVASRALEASELSALRVEGALGCLRFAVSRITDFELRAPPGTAAARDYRRFLARMDAIEKGALDAAFPG
jgi:homoserine kinase type II